MAHGIEYQIDQVRDGTKLRTTSDPLTANSAMDPNDLQVVYLLNSGSNDMGVDGSDPSVSFSYAPPAGKILVAGRMIFYLEMSGLGFDSVKFGNITALTNGVSIQADGIEIQNWKDNVDIVTSMYDSEGYAAFAKTENSIAGRWTFTKAAAGSFKGIRIASSFAMIIQDDLSAAGIIFRAKIHGILIDAD